MYNKSVLRWIRYFLDICTAICEFFARTKRNCIPVTHDPHLFESATSLANRIRTGQIKCEEVMRSYINRLAAVNPIINAQVDERFADAMLEAAAIDRRVASELSGNRPADGMESIDDQPFLGVPLSVKDSVAVRNMKQICGLASRKDVKSEEDADVVRLLRQAGAIVFVTTNTPELCLATATNNTVIGLTRNPYDLARSPGGSSGGEAALISSAGSVIGIGSDYGGSVRIPAALCGIFGHKATRQVISVKGKFPMFDKMDELLVLGPLCRYACDLLPILKVICKHDLMALRLDEHVDLAKLKIYYMEEDGSLLNQPVIPLIPERMKTIFKHFSSVHGIEARKVHITHLKYTPAIFSYLNLNRTSAKKLAQVNNLFLEFLKFLVGCSKHTFPLLTVLVLEKVFGPNYTKANKFTGKILEMRDKLEAKFDDLLGADGVLLFPTVPRSAASHGAVIFNVFDTSYTMISNLTGCPATQCPIGLDDNGLPLGIQVIARKHNDRLTIAVAREIEKIFGGWIPPFAKIGGQLINNNKF